MTQQFHDVSENETLAASRGEMMANDRTILSCNAGTTFPAAAEVAELGMLCYRTDQKKLWQLTDTVTTPWTWVLVADLSNTVLGLEGADARYAAIGHNHAYDVNGEWLRDAGDDATVKLFGNTRQMVFRTDGETPYLAGLEARAFAWMYGGDASTNRIGYLDKNGTLWTKSYGRLEDRFLGKNSSDTIPGGVAIYANDGAAAADPAAGKGRLQYSGGEWNIAAGTDSSDVVHFRRGGNDVAIVANDGKIWSNAYGWLDQAFLKGTSTARPGTTKLFRRDADTGVSVQVDADGAGRWRLRGYNDAAGTFNAECRVGYADAAGTATVATTCTNASHATTADTATVAQSAYGNAFNMGNGIAFQVVANPYGVGWDLQLVGTGAATPFSWGYRPAGTGGTTG